MKTPTITDSPEGVAAGSSQATLLAGLSIGTIFALKNTPDNAVAIMPNGPEANGKYSAWLMIGEADGIRPLISTKPVFDTAESAVEHLKNVLKAGRDVDLIGRPANS